MDADRDRPDDEQQVAAGLRVHHFVGSVPVPRIRRTEKQAVDSAGGAVRTVVTLRLRHGQGLPAVAGSLRHGAEALKVQAISVWKQVPVRPVSGQLSGHSLFALIGGQGLYSISDGFLHAVLAGNARVRRCPRRDRVCRSSEPDFNSAVRRTALRLDDCLHHGLHLLLAVVRLHPRPLVWQTCCAHAGIPHPHSWAARQSKESGIDLVLPLVLVVKRMTCLQADVLHGSRVSAKPDSECGEGLLLVDWGRRAVSSPSACREPDCGADWS